MHPLFKMEMLRRQMDMLVEDQRERKRDKKSGSCQK
jgi:hypothetical protein